MFKFDIGDAVYFMRDGKPTSAPVLYRKACPDARPGQTGNIYTTKEGELDEADLFPTGTKLLGDHFAKQDAAPHKAIDVGDLVKTSEHPNKTLEVTYVFSSNDYIIGKEVGGERRHYLTLSKLEKTVDRP